MGLSSRVKMMRISRIPISISTETRVVNHGFVIYEQKLLAHNFGDSVTPHPSSTGHGDALETR